MEKANKKLKLNKEESISTNLVNNIDKIIMGSDKFRYFILCVSISKKYFKFA